MTYICAGKGSPGLRGWVGVAAGVGHRTPYPSTLPPCIAPGLPHRVFESISVLSLRTSSPPPVAACLGVAQAPGPRRGGRSVLMARYDVGIDIWASQVLQGDSLPTRGGVAEPPGEG